MTKVLLVERGQVKAKSIERMLGSGFAVVEVADITKVRIGTIGELDIDRDMVVMALFEALEKSDCVTRSHFVEALNRRLKDAERSRLGTPKEESK